MRFLVVLAAQKVPFWQDGRFSLALTGMLLAGVLLLGAMIFAWVGRSFKEDRKRGICSPEDQLNEFRAMLEAGELTPEEFEIVKGKLGRKIRKKDTSPSEGAVETGPKDTNEAGNARVQEPEKGADPEDSSKS